ncbi:MAG: hypothetical protein RL600_522, partial [Actinomycetota bacterium]
MRVLLITFLLVCLVLADPAAAECRPFLENVSGGSVTDCYEGRVMNDAVGKCNERVALL